MHESMKKRANLNAEILKILKERYGFGLDYIRKSLRGDRTGVIPDKIKKDYKLLEAASKVAITDKAKELNS